MPDPIPPDKLAELTRAVMQRARFPFLATIDGDQPRVRSLMKAARLSQSMRRRSLPFLKRRYTDAFSAPLLRGLGLS